MKEEIIVENQYLRYLCYKPESNARGAVVFLHGWRSQKEVWAFAMSRLRDDFEVYALDLPGFGGSSAPKKTFNLTDYSEIVEKFVLKLNLQNVVLVGHSFGGRIAIKLSSKHPQWLKAIVLVDAAGFVTRRAAKEILGIAAIFFRRLSGFNWYQNLRRIFHKLIGAEDYLATPHLQKTFINIVNEDLSADLAKIVCPALIVTGENDKDTPVEFGKKMHNLISNSKFEIIKSAGHFSFLDKPKEFIDLVKKFFNEKNI